MTNDKGQSPKPEMVGTRGRSGSACLDRTYGGLQGSKAALSQAALEEIIRRIVQVAQPERIILFGSAARGEMGPHSDVDLLVIKSGEFDQNRPVGDIYVNLHGVGQAVDVILVTPVEVMHDFS